MHRALEIREKRRRVLSSFCLDYLALQPTSNLNDGPVTVHAIAWWTRRTPLSARHRWSRARRITMYRIGRIFLDRPRARPNTERDIGKRCDSDRDRRLGAVASRLISHGVGGTIHQFCASCAWPGDRPRLGWRRWLLGSRWRVPAGGTDCHRGARRCPWLVCPASILGWGDTAVQVAVGLLIVRQGQAATTSGCYFLLRRSASAPSCSAWDGVRPEGAVPGLVAVPCS